MQLIAGEGLTFREALSSYSHLPEESDLILVFIDHGFGDRRMDEFIEPAYLR